VTLVVLVHLALLLLFPPLLLGVIGKTKAIFAGRSGPPLLQPYRDLAKLVRKGAVYSRTTTWVFRAGPLVSLAATLCAGLLVPLQGDRLPWSFSGDVLLFVYLLGLGRFFTMVAALDTGSSFEGMGASREAAFAALAEPALLLVLASATVRAHGFSFENAWAVLPGYPSYATVLAAAALFAVLLAENSRIPIDDPNTHLELTMIHEVMILDHSGPDLAGIVYGSALKLFLMGSILVHYLIPIPTDGGWRGLALLVVGLLGVGLLVGAVESTMARLRLPRVPQFLIGASIVAALGLAVTLYGGHP
jgi:formate hydrogenlyase subunit 4